METPTTEAEIRKMLDLDAFSSYKPKSLADEVIVIDGVEFSEEAMSEALKKATDETIMAIAKYPKPIEAHNHVGGMASSGGEIPIMNVLLLFTSKDVTGRIRKLLNMF